MGWGGQASPPLPGKLTVDQAVKIALMNHPSIREARELAAALDARVGAAKSGFYPQVRLDAIGKMGLSGATNALGLIGLPASPFFRNLSQAANLEQDVFDFGRTKHGVEAARAEAEAGLEAVAETRIRVAAEAQEAFLRVLSAQNQARVKDQALRERQVVLRKTQEFAEVGLRSKLDAEMAQVGAGNAETEVAQARNEEQIAWAKLFGALGQAEGPRPELVEPQISIQPPGDLAGEVKRALASRPDLKAIEKETEAQEEKVAYFRSLQRPALKGVWTGGYARFSRLSLKELMAGGLGLTVPIYTGKALESRVGEQKHELESLQARQAEWGLTIEAEVSRAHADAVGAAQAAGSLQQTAAHAEAALRLARVRYEAQLASFVDLLTAETAAEAARGTYTQALYNYASAMARLNAAMGYE
jgi:outer membrane protein